MPTTVPVKDLDHLLQETLGPDLKIESVLWKPLTDPGENYGSLILSVDATVVKNDKATKVLNLVVKLPPPTQYLLDLFNSSVCFDKELVFYRKIAPKFIELQLDSGIENEKIVKLIPQFYGGRLGLKEPSTFDDQAAIVLENLISEGYAMRDRLIGLDLEHTKIAVDQLAKFHAAAIGLKIKYPEFFETIVIPALEPTANDTAMVAVNAMVKRAHDIYKELPEAQPYMERIDKTLMYNYEVDLAFSKPSEPWGTIVHNDFWSNNILFKYNDAGKPIGIKIVDFQLGFYNSGVIDLIFLLLSSAQKEVLDNNLDEMLDRYYKSFVDFLTSLKVDTKIFSKRGFDEQIREYAPLKFGQCIMMIPVITAAKGTIKNMEDINGDENFSVIGDRRKVETKLLYILDIYDKKQWLVD